MRLLTGVILLFVSNSVFARINFHFPDTTEGWTCKQKIVEWMDEVDEKLPDGWTPTDFHVFYQNIGSLHGGIYRLVDTYSDNGDFSMESLEQKIILTRCEKPFFIHEYGHAVIAGLMMRESPSYKYSLIWESVDLKDIDQAKAEFVERIKNSREQLERLESVNPSESQGEADIAKIKESLSKDEIMVKRLTLAQELQARSSFPLNRFDSDIALDAFIELFADTLTVLIIEDWSAVKKSLIPLVEELKVRYPNLLDTLSPVKLSHGERTRFFSVVLDCRDFISGLPIENASHENEWVKEDPYCQFTSMRSWIRDTMEGNRALVPADMIQALGFGIIDVYEKELIPDPNNLERSLPEKNQSLQRATAYHLPLNATIRGIFKITD